MTDFQCTHARTHARTYQAHTDDGHTTSVTGSVFGNEPCLVSLDNYKNFPALNLHEGSVLKFRNKDQPGAVSGVLDILEKHKVRLIGCVGADMVGFRYHVGGWVGYRSLRVLAPPTADQLTTTQRPLNPTHKHTQVNIANLTLGRQDSDLALCLMSVDGQVPEEAIKDLRALPQLNDVRTAKLGAGSK